MIDTRYTPCHSMIESRKTSHEDESRRDLSVSPPRWNLRAFLVLIHILKSQCPSAFPVQNHSSADFREFLLVRRHGEASRRHLALRVPKLGVLRSVCSIYSKCKSVLNAKSDLVYVSIKCKKRPTDTTDQTRRDGLTFNKATWS
jgi:hypothetical protein